MQPSFGKCLIVVVFVLAACDRNVNLPVAEANAATVAPRLHPPLAAEAVDGHVYEYH